jgi:hypothetical protein
MNQWLPQWMGKWMNRWNLGEKTQIKDLKEKCNIQ